MAQVIAQLVPLNRDGSVIMELPEDVADADEPMGFINPLVGDHLGCLGYFALRALENDAGISTTDLVLKCTFCNSSLVIPAKVRTYKGLWLYLVDAGVVDEDDLWPRIY